MDRILTVRELLAGDEPPLDHWVLLPDEPKWQLDTRCAIVEGDELDEPEDHPLAAEHALIGCAIGTNEVQDIIANAKEQIAAPSPDQLLAAFEYYIDNDAFIDFAENDATSGG